ncbi:MAG: DUF4214 domain-containing protein [Oscillospiraceae bacterium]|jgi:hypothetical protein|nr:DUF4214 domain-containing protein [Oscillospiraceae bacterium]
MKRLKKSIISILILITMVFSFAINGFVGYAQEDEVHINEAGINGFVERLYLLVLERRPEAYGFGEWTNRLKRGETDGARMAHGFFYSTEFLNRNLSNEQYLEILYRAILGRKPEAFGWNAWLERMKTNMSRYDVFVGFINSVEFGEICESYGINVGTVPPPANTLAGDTMIVRVWNHMVRAHFPGISDRPAHIAGIIGNLQSEAGSTLCPFQQEVSTRIGIGLMQWSFGRRTLVENYMWANGISREAFEAEMNKHLDGVCTNPRHIHPIDFLDHVLFVQINYMFYELQHTSERNYMQFVNHPTHTTGPEGARSYAELFCSMNLRPSAGFGDTNNILDPGVLEARLNSPFNTGINEGRISFNSLNIRRNNAENIFHMYLRNHG